MRIGQLARFALAIVISMCAYLNAQDAPSQANASASHVRYRLIDLGTLGGPVSYESVDGEGSQILNNSGVVASSADTAIPDPNAPDFCFNPECFVTHAVQWKHGLAFDLGALPGLNSSAASAINDSGGIVGFSQNGATDPLGGFPETRAVFWNADGIHELGTLGGLESLAIGIANNGQVIGMATVDDTPDPFSAIAPWPSPTHPFIWKDGEMIDLGTLGGPDAFIGATCVNQGLAVGMSLTSSTPDPTSGIPPGEPYVWEADKMRDLGSLGGSFGFAQCGNNRGQVIGASSLSEHPFACFTGEPGCHPFLWEKGTLRDLGTLGGDNGIPIWINDTGDIVGEADTVDNQATHAFLWRRGVMTDLGSLGDHSQATAVSSKGQVVGWYYIAGRTEPPFRHAFIWEEGGSMVDLNTLIPPSSGLELVAADNINERGEIVGVGVPSRCFPDFCGHLFLLIPCAKGETQGCENNRENPNAEIQSNPATTAIGSKQPQALTPKERVAAWHAQMVRRYHVRSLGAQRE